MIENVDCLTGLSHLKAGSAELIFADPPFNINYMYDEYADDLDKPDYLTWCGQWIARCYDVLSPTGSLWLAIGHEMSPEVACVASKAGFHRQQLIIWYYTFGTNCKKKFTRSHTHIWWLIKNQKKYTFNAEAVLVESYRQANGDKRAAPGGRIPDDVWQFPRVCGTHKERQGWHPCQMPLSIMERIVRVASDPGQLVVDPFSGSGTTGVACAKLKREFKGFETSPNYTDLANKRIVEASQGV